MVCGLVHVDRCPPSLPPQGTQECPFTAGGTYCRFSRTLLLYSEPGTGPRPQGPAQHSTPSYVPAPFHFILRRESGFPSLASDLPPCPSLLSLGLQAWTPPGLLSLLLAGSGFSS